MNLFKALLSLALLASAAHANTKISSSQVTQKRNLPKLFKSAEKAILSKSADVVATRGGATPVKVSTGFVVGFGMLLAFNSGFVNGACLSGVLSSDGTKQASAAVTGGWTNSALGAAAGETAKFLFNAKCILSYAAGSMISGLINPTPSPFEIATGPLRTLFIIGAALLAGSSYLSEQGSAKTFIYLAALANGLQNSITSTTTANMCRTAHFSGCTSDMGTFLGQVLRGNNANLLKLKVFAGLALSFWSGGFISYSVTNQMAAKSLLFSAALYLVLAGMVGTLKSDEKTK